MKLGLNIIAVLCFFILVSACSTNIKRIPVNPGFKTSIMPVKDKPYVQYIIKTSKHGWDVFHLREDTMVEDMLKDVNDYAIKNNVKVIPDPASIRYHWFLFWGHVTATFITTTEY